MTQMQIKIKHILTRVLITYIVGCKGMQDALHRE